MRQRRRGSMAALGALAATLAGAPAAAVPLAPPAAPGAQDLPADPWTLAVDPLPPHDAHLAEPPARHPPGTLGRVVFPADDHAAPISPTSAHDTVAPPRLGPFVPPTESAAPPLAPDPDEAGADDGISVFARLMRDAPDEVREGARFGLRDVLAAGIAVHAMGLGEAGGAVAPLSPATLAAIEAEAAEFARTEQRRGLVLLGGLCLAAAAIAGVWLLRRQRGPRPLRSRRFG